MKNFKDTADVVNFTNASGGTMAAGSLQALGTNKLCGVPIDDIEDTKTGAMYIGNSKVFELAKNTGEGAIVQFQPLYRAAGGNITVTKGTNPYAGMAADVAADADTKVKVILNKQTAVAADIQ